MSTLNFNKPGKFRLSAELLSSAKDMALLIMGKCVIVRAEQLFVSGHIEYEAYSDEFRELGEGEAPPEYEWVVNRETGEVSAMEVKS